MDFGTAIEERDTCRIWSGLFISSVGDVKVIEGGEDMASHGLSWVAVEFLISGGIS